MNENYPYRFLKRKLNVTDKSSEDDFDEGIVNQSGISLLMTEHQNGIEFRILNVNMEELIAAAANKKEDHLNKGTLLK